MSWNARSPESNSTRMIAPAITRERPGDQQPGQVVEQSSLVPEAQQPARDRGDVEQQVGRGDRRTGDVQDAELDRQQQHRAGHAAGVVISASRNAQTAPTGHSQGTPQPSPGPAWPPSSADGHYPEA